MSELAEENVQVLAQLVELVARMRAPRYQQHFGSHSPHTVGKHVRHIIDHYEIFLHHLQNDSVATVNYENRLRDESLETVPAIACDRLQKICDHLLDLDDADRQSAVPVDHPTTRTSITLDSSVGRELAFLSSHTIHHMAIIGLLAEQMGLEPAPDFGVHPSTLRHWHRQRGRAAAS